MLVAGYPKLLSESGFLVNQTEVELVNDSTSRFNEEINKIVDECAAEGMNIFFVDVENEFDGHEAYTQNPWINSIYIGAKGQELQETVKASQYSVHPNEKGAQAYARCVNAKIKELEEQKSSISGKVASASDDKAMSGVQIKIHKTQAEYAVYETLWTALTTDETGNYSATLPEGNYRLEVSAEGYISFSVYVAVTDGQTQYMETFLMVEDGATEKGIVKATG